MGNENIPAASKPPAKQPAPAHRGRSASLPLPVIKPKRLALLIGCKYTKSKDYQKLLQTHRDVLRLRKLFIDVYHYDPADIIVLLDDDKHIAPTRENIIKEMKKLVAGAKAGDSFFFYFAGHGEQAPCETGEEYDNMDEAIVPCDATGDKETWIIDNDLNKLLVRKIPVNAQLIAFFDMCHSGTAMDLNHYCYNEEGSVHALKRTSHGTVESESRKISELPGQESPDSAQDPSSSKTNQKSDTRRFSYVKRTSTIHCELSEGTNGDSLVASTKDQIEAGDSTKPEPRRGYSCADCGGFLDEHDSNNDEVSVHIEDDPKEDQQGHIPDRPDEVHERKPQRKTKRLPSLNVSPPTRQERQSANSANAVTRRHSIASPHEIRFGCLSTLRLDWLPLFFKRKFGIKSKNTNNEKKSKSVSDATRSRTSTANSLTPFLSSAPAPASAPPPAPPTSGTEAMPVIRMPKPTRKFFKRESTPVVQAPGLGDIQEDAPVSSFHDHEVGEIPRCMSPQQYTASGPVSPTSVTTPETPVPTAATAIRGQRRVTRNVAADGKQKRCNCRAASGVQEHGQVITIGGCNDAELAWETTRGTLTSALIEILEKDANPTYESLLSSLQAFLNGMSDELRQHVAWTKKHLRFKKLKRDAKKHEQQQQQANQKPRSNSVSTPESRRSSHKSGDNIATDMLNGFDQVLGEAQGGPVQTATIGSQNLMNLAKERFNPRGSLPPDPITPTTHHVEHHS